VAAPLLHHIPGFHCWHAHKQLAAGTAWRSMWLWQATQ
jgi:hypothetical protein